MPCDIGYRSVAKAKVAAPEPQAFEARLSPPELDEDLLEKLGQEDPVFAEWLRELDSGPLVAKALEQALQAVRAPKGFEFAVRAGRLAVRSETRSASERFEALRVVSRVGERWQLEVLRIVAELLEFEVELQATTENGAQLLVLEGEKPGAQGAVREFIRITLKASGDAQLSLEHYRSPEALEADEDRLQGLAQKLGLKLAIQGRRRSGQAIPEGAVHRHPGKKRGKS
ncbi:MAG: hypothetical protein QM765_13640 [Myxococcales bacterium]